MDGFDELRQRIQEHTAELRAALSARPSRAECIVDARMILVRRNIGDVFAILTAPHSTLRSLKLLRVGERYEKTFDRVGL